MRTSLRLIAFAKGVSAPSTVAATCDQISLPCIAAVQERSSYYALASSLGRLPTKLCSESHFSTSSAAAQPASLTAVEGDIDKLLQSLDSVISSDNATPQDVAAAASALAYLQAKGNRRIWGKIFEKASELKSSFDAASLTSFLWASTAANVSHFKTLFELTGPAATLLNSFTPAQLSFVVEAFGKAGVNDVQFYNAISALVVPKAASYSAAEVARLLYGFASAGVQDGRLVKALAAALLSKVDTATPKDLVQAVWALAKLRRLDKPLIDAAAKSAAGKLETPADGAALLWALAALNYKAGDAASRAAAAVRAAPTALPPSVAIHTAWALTVTGAGDKDLLDALFGGIAAALDAGLEDVHPRDVALLAEAAALGAAKGAALAPKAAAYAWKVHGVVAEADAVKESAADTAFKADVALATAKALGAKYVPEIEKALASFATSTPSGLKVPIAATLEGGPKLAVEALPESALTVTLPATPLGGAEARKLLLESDGYIVLQVPQTEWATLSSDKAKGSYILEGLRKLPGASSKASALLKEFDKPFDPYAE